MEAQPKLTDRKREAIVQAATALFRAHGFDGTSMDKVSAAADVSKRTLYNHFPSKEELFAEILRQLWQSSAAQLEQAYRPDRPLREQLMALAQQKMALLNDDDFLDLARVAIAATIHSPERAQEMLQRLGDKESGLLAWIREARRDGRLQSCDPVQAAQQLEALLKGFAFWPQVAMGQPKLGPRAQREVCSEAVALFLARYAPGEAAV
jgi:TetR/AcrR family transcriptional regulator of autoinduction and epiphytic fitness